MNIEKYRKRELNRVSESTVNSRVSALRRLEKFVDGEEPTVEDVEEWVDNLIDMHDRGAIKSSTIRQYLSAADYYFELMLGEYDELEHLKRRLPKKDVDHGEYMNEEEWEQFRNSIHNYRDRAYIETMYWYSRRPTEVILLNEGDVDMENDTIAFNILKKKRDDRGNLLPLLELLDDDGEVYESYRVFRVTFELISEVKKHLEPHLKYKPDRTQTVIYDGDEMEVKPIFTARRARMSYDTARRIIKNGAEAAGIEKNITPKSERHSRSTHLNWAGHTPEQIADKIMVHDPDSDVIGAYVHPRDEHEVRRVIRAGEEE